MLKIAYTSLSLLLLLTLAGCSDMGSSVTITPGQVSFANQVQPLFNTYCVSCHNPGSAPTHGNLDLTSYATLMDTTGPSKPIHAPLIIPNQADSSYLYKRITGVIQPQMPLGGPYLSESQISIIEDWINQGAKNN